MAQYRVILRARADCFHSGACEDSDPRLRNSTRFLVKPGEHTWGLPGISDPGQSVDWTNAAFNQVKNNPVCCL